MKLALIAFVGHGPGLRLFTKYRFSPQLLRTNLVAIALTIAATALAVVVVPEHRLTGGVLTFSVGHFAWSFYLARVVATSSR